MNDFTTNVFVTNDLSFAAYLSMHKIKLVDAKRLGKSFKFTFEKTAEIKQLQMSYVISESAEHDAHVARLKKIVFGDN